MATTILLLTPCALINPSLKAIIQSPGPIQDLILLWRGGAGSSFCGASVIGGIRPSKRMALDGFEQDPYVVWI